MYNVTSEYFSGQGVVLIGQRTAAGKPKRLYDVGNVSAVKASMAVTTQEHHESRTGQRGIDLRLQTETKATMAITMESLNAANLALLTRGDAARVIAGTSTDEAINWYGPYAQPLAYIKVAVTNVKRGAQALTAYVNETTAWDYRVNTDAGSIQFNDGSTVACDKLTTGGTAPTGITVGYPTVITVTNTASVGDYAMFTGFAGANAALVNGIPAKVLAASGTAVSIDIDTTGKTITLGTPLSIFEGQALTCTYTYAGQQLISAMTQPVTDYYVRFEGLNTADSNKPVVLEAFKFEADPLKELDLISDSWQSGVLEGSLLYDSVQPSGSNYFRVKKLT